MADQSGLRIGAHEIRRRFVDFFVQRQHRAVPSSSLVPSNDPTLLFVNAGMVQFKDVFLGREKRDFSRAVSVQKCLRAGGKHNDLDNVGFTPRHQTFFEMLGNFSFGDYFKAEAIAWAWEFLTADLGLPAERLVVSVYDGHGERAPADDEAYELWTQYIPRDRIHRLPSSENFWMMGDTGPCGPCSEIHIHHGGPAPGDAGKPGKGPAAENDRYTEIWNLVFMQYEKLASGELVALPRPSVDTGAGLERLAVVVNGLRSNYETDLLAPLVRSAKELARAQGGRTDVEAPFQVIADHARATAFLVADGVFPDRAGRAYVLRRIVRRAIRYGTEVGLDEPFFDRVCAQVVDEFGSTYPELHARKSTIVEVVQSEELAFRRTLRRGLRRLDGELERLADGDRALSPEVAAELYDTYGFPLDLTGLICKERGFTLDEGAADADVHRRQQREGDGKLELGQEQAIADVWFRLKDEVATTEFVGYEHMQVDATVTALVKQGRLVQRADTGDVVEVLFDRTAFYAESGGQVGDTGNAHWSHGRGRVLDTQRPLPGFHAHRVEVLEGHAEVGQRWSIAVDESRRAAIRRNHSATHLLHHALRHLLGPHVIQKGSLVSAERLRFDFSHNRALTADQLRALELDVNQEILRNANTSVRVMDLEAARATQAIGLFEAKYGEHVRVVGIGHHSLELCGGTHVEHTGDIGLFAIVAETGIAQGVRRIEAVTGMASLARVQELSDLADILRDALHVSSVEDIPPRIVKLQADLRARERDIGTLQQRLATAGTKTDDAPVEVDGVKIVARKVMIADAKTLRAAADALRDKVGSGVVVLGAESDGKATLLVAVTEDLRDRLHAGKIVGALAQYVDGRGGGRPDLAQAGGPNAAGLDRALSEVVPLVQQFLRGP